MSSSESVAKVLQQARRIEYVPVKDLVPAKRNPKKHAEADLDVSVGRFGYTEPVLMDERTGRLVAGHGRLEALNRLKAKGLPPPDGVVEKDDVWLVPVVRGWGSRNDSEADAYLIASNQLTAAGGWDNAALVEMLRELDQARALEGVGFSHDELSKLLDSAAPPGGASGGDPDDAPEAPKGKSYVEVGDMFELGDHRILCGSAILPHDVDRVMRKDKARICWTDPPWNIAYDGEVSRGRKSKGREIVNDNLGEDFPQFAAQFCGEISRVLFPGAPIYMAMSAQEWGVIHTALVEMGFHWSSTIIWAKDVFNLCVKDYHAQYEPIWYGWKDGAPRLVKLEDRTQADVWSIPRPRKADLHPTMKPVELVVRALKNSSRHGDICFEPFSGSGTTLMACEQSGRHCRAIELDPRYVQVALERWELWTGRKAKKVK